MSDTPHDPRSYLFIILLNNKQLQFAHPILLLQLGKRLQCHANPPKIWNKMWEELFQSSRKEITLGNYFKVLSRWYVTPARIAKWLLTYSSAWFRRPRCHETHMVDMTQN